MMIGKEYGENTGVTVKKFDLLDAIKKNREGHRKVFLEAQEGYRKAVIDFLDENLRRAREGKLFETAFRLPVPVDHTKDYDRIIRMLDMCTKDEIFVTEHEFQAYVQDDWSWKEQFVGTTSNYLRPR